MVILICQKKILVNGTWLLRLCKKIMSELSVLNGLINEKNTSLENTPVLFIGHGSPMNAIEENEFSKTWKEIAKLLQVPNTILCISAHWETNGTFVTAMQKPSTIHDFYGFPPELYKIQYAAPENPDLAKKTKNIVKITDVNMDYNWGLDHGCWSVINNMYPDANIPVIQLSLDRTKPPSWHFELSRDLKVLRKKGVLIIGSGNIVHNLRLYDFYNTGKPYGWAVESNEILKKWIRQKNFKELTDFPHSGKYSPLAVPTNEHYLPMLYSLGLIENHEDIDFFNDKILSSLSMTSFISINNKKNEVQ